MSITYNTYSNNTAYSGTGIQPGYTDSAGMWQPTQPTQPLGSPNINSPYYVSPKVPMPPASSGLDQIKFDLSLKENTMQEEYIVGDGEVTSFTFPTREKYPSVAVYLRKVEGDGDEKTTTLTVVDPSVKIVSEESVTVTFAEAPARRGVVILVG